MLVCCEGDKERRSNDQCWGSVLIYEEHSCEELNRLPFRR